MPYAFLFNLEICFHKLRPRFSPEGFAFMAIVTAIFFAFFCLLRSRRRAVSWSRTFVATSLASYVVFIYRFTVFLRTTKDAIQFRPCFLYSYVEIFKHGSADYLWSDIFNIALFAPLGSAFAFLFYPRWRLREGVLCALGFSLSIEILQLVLRKGIFEFDDLFHNALGFVLGYLFWRGCRKTRAKIIERRER